MSRFLRDLGLLVLSVLAAVAVLLILVNPGATAVNLSIPVDHVQLGEIEILAGKSYQPQVKKSSIESAAILPAPIARMTVAEPVTMSPPAHTPFFVVLPVLRSA